MSVKILIVDDEPHLEIVISQLFRKRIKSGELAFLFALHGEEALDILQREQDVDIVFSDINMPVMNGLTLLKRLNEAFPLIKTVVITAYGDMKNIRAAMNHGAFDFINKPINFKDLRITLDKTLEHVQQMKGLHQERKRLYLAEKLGEMSLCMSSSLEFDEVQELLLDKLMEVFTCSEAALCRREELDANLKVVVDRGPLAVGKQTLEAMLAMPWSRLIESGPFIGEEGVDSDRRSVLALNLPRRGQEDDLVILLRHPDRPFAENESELATSLVQQAAVSLDNAQLFTDVRLLATTDTLTGLENRRHFMELAQKEIVRSRRYGNPLSLIMLDVDNFKCVNDKHGHPFGDEVLKAVAEALQNTCRKTDLVGRYGGDEMVILLIETDPMVAAEIAGRIQDAVAGLSLSKEDGETLSVTVSQGVATMETEADTLSRLIHRADQLLLLAKENGRNRTEVA